jgi:hypothetical protein
VLPGYGEGPGHRRIFLQLRLRPGSGYASERVLACWRQR